MRSMVLALVMAVILWQSAGCGVGGFETPPTATTSTAPTRAATATVRGVLSYGTIADGTVRLFPLHSDGTLGTALAEVHTTPFGRYSSQISYAAPLIVRGSGSYSDAATGAALVIDEATPLLAAVDTALRYREIAVTPLTHLAALLMKSASASEIAAANKLVSDTFKVDVVAVQPVPPSAGPLSAAAQQEKDYTLALAALSQAVADHYQGSLGNALAAWQGELAASGALSPGAARQFQDSLQTFLASPRNLTGVAPGDLHNLFNVGGSVLALKIAAAGVLSADDKVGAIAATLILPPGVTVRADFTRAPYLPLAAALAPSGVAGSDSAFFSEASYHPPSGTTTGFLTFTLTLTPNATSLGEFVTVYCDLPPGSTVSAADFSLSELRAFAADGAPLPQVQGELR